MTSFVCTFSRPNLPRIFTPQILRLSTRGMSFEKVPGGARKFSDGHSIPLVGLGTYKITGKLIRTAVNAALDAGYRMFDTAKYYKNEPEIGEALEELLPKYNLTREDVFITTKLFSPQQNVAEGVAKLVDESLKNLRTTYIDLYLIHYPKPDDNANDDPNNKTIRKETYLALEKEKEAGRIRSVGVSNYESHHIDEIREYGKKMPVANQIEYHPHFTRDQLKKYCDENEIFFQAFSSLARQEPCLIEDPVVVQLAEKHETTVNLILLAFALCQGVGIVPKSTHVGRIKENLQVVDLKLSAEEIESLHKLDKNKAYIRCTGWLVK